MNKEHLKIKVSDLKANPKNPKQHDDKLIKDSIQDLGFVDDIVIDEKNVILAGHGRLKALEELGTKEIDVIKISGWTQEQKDRYLLLSNKSVEKGGWDFEMLAQIDKELLKQVGFESQELDKIFKDLNKDDDEVPEVPEKPTSKLGDIYQLGKHRLVCGDATKADDVGKLMDGDKANMVFTDPPYNVGLEYNEYKDNKSTEQYLEFVDKFYGEIKDNLKEGGNIYIMSGDKFLLELGVKFKNQFRFSQILFWVKENPTLGNSDYQYNYEAILYGWNGGIHKYYGNSVVPAANFVVRDKGILHTEHKAQRPIKLVEDYIKNSSKRNDIILDLFGGSGSTLIACEQLDRKCYMMELDPRYTDVIISRWENFTKLKAEKL